MGGKYGYDQVRKLAFFGLAFGKSAYDAAKAEGKVAKAEAFLSCMDEASGLLTLDRAQLEQECKELDVEDRAALFADCAEEFELEDHVLEEKVEAAIGAGLAVLDGIEKAVGIWKGAA